MDGQEQKNRKQPDKITLSACILLACVAILNIVFVFFAPSTISVLFTDSRIASRWFAIGGILVVGLSGVMAVFSPHRKYWLVAQIVLTLLDVVLVTGNLV